MKLKIVNKKKFKSTIAKGVMALMFITMIYGVIFHICTYPEKYSCTMKYQLKNDVQAGKQEAIKYYQERYTSKNIKLWED